MGLAQMVSQEHHVGSFVHDEQLIDFYLRANSLLPDGGTVVDLGVGSGSRAGGVGNDLIRNLITFRFRNPTVIGVDVDEAVLGNSFVDRQIVWTPGTQIDVDAESVDLVSTHWVLEHVEDPEEFTGEVYRMLRPGGWFATRTVNADSYVGWNRFVKPGPFRDFLMRTLGQQGAGAEKFPVQYKLNRKKAIRRVFDSDRFETYVFKRRSAQRYGETGLPYLVFRLLNKTPIISYTDLLVFARKR
jgi:SAM-dependent methyltransferase